MAVGHGGQVLVSESTRALLDERVALRDLGSHRLKDFSRAQRLFQLEIDGLPSDFPPLKTLDNAPRTCRRLPTPSSAATRELAEAQALLRTARRPTAHAHGAGGTGKTRLALQLAADVADQFMHGVFFVSLAPVRDWELVAPTIARTLDLREQPGETVLETLTSTCATGSCCSLLDNFEQVLAAAPALAGLCSPRPRGCSCSSRAGRRSACGRARLPRSATRRSRSAPAGGRRRSGRVRVGQAVRRARPGRGGRVRRQRRERGGGGRDLRPARRPAAGDRARGPARPHAHAPGAAATPRPAARSC